MSFQMLLIRGPPFENLGTEKDECQPPGCNPASSCGLSPWKLRQVCANPVAVAVAVRKASRRFLPVPQG